MLKGGQGILETPCRDVNRSVPYFKEMTLSEGNPNQMVYDFFEDIASAEIDPTDKVTTV